MDIQAWLQGTTDRRPPDQRSSPSDDNNRTTAIQPAIRHYQEEQRTTTLNRKLREVAAQEEILIQRRRNATPDGGRFAQHYDERSPFDQTMSNRSESDIPSSAAKQYYRRQRRKTRADRYELKAPKTTNERKHTVKAVQARKTRRDDPEAALGVVRAFELNSRCKKRRLTLEPARQATLFQHGRSAKHAAGQEGLPDLSFNELKFLQRTKQQDENADPRIDDATLDQQKQDAQISVYFQTKQPHKMEDLASREVASTHSRSRTSEILCQMESNNDIFLTGSRHPTCHTIDTTTNRTSMLEHVVCADASSTSMPLPEHHPNNSAAVLSPCKHRSQSLQSPMSVPGFSTPQMLPPQRRSGHSSVYRAGEHNRTIEPFNHEPQPRGPREGYSMQKMRSNPPRYSPRVLSRDHEPGRRKQPRSPAQLELEHDIRCYSASDRFMVADQVPRSRDAAERSASALAYDKPFRRLAPSPLEGLPRRQLHSFDLDVSRVATAATAELQASTSNTMLWQPVRSHAQASRETCNVMQNSLPSLLDHSLENSSVKERQGLAPSPRASDLILEGLDQPRLLSCWSDHPMEDSSVNQVTVPSIDRAAPSELHHFWRPNRLY